ncbi:hypothetical protein OG607_19945 [Streptomyces sp. NBC_01537]|uniref:hypothetical protein n=1 Tax=Streptomyces sp. NBC_01537 TaxID=2903896 RepID=UPI00386D0E5C
MARVVCVHGIGKQQSGEQSLSNEWVPAMRDGMRRGGAPDAMLGAEVGVAFYGDLFRPPGRRLGVGDPRYKAADVEGGLEEELLLSWWRHAAQVDPGVVPPDAQTLVRVPGSVQAGLRALSQSKFFAEVAMSSLIFDLKQVSRYLTDPQLRGDAIERVWSAMGRDTEVVVAHSLGSVVAYEALCTMPQDRVRAFVTLGSPLGVRNLIFERLRPEPGAWPGGSSLVWTNVADAGDVVALEKDLSAFFGERVISVLVHNGARAHDASAYLTEALTGEAIARGLGAR